MLIALRRRRLQNIMEGHGEWARLDSVADGESFKYSFQKRNVFAT